MTQWMWSPTDVFRGRLVLGGLGVFVILILVALLTGEMHEWLLVGLCLTWGGLDWVQEVVFRREVDRDDHVRTRVLLVVSAAAIAGGLIHLAVDELGQSSKAGDILTPMTATLRRG